MIIFPRQLRSLSRFQQLCLIILIYIICYQFFQSYRSCPCEQAENNESVIISNTSRSIRNQNKAFRSRSRTVRHSPHHINVLHLCSTDFQRYIDLINLNRTFLLYEVEWRDRRRLDILGLLVESVQFPLRHVGDMSSEFSNLYSIQCLYNEKFSPGQLRHINSHEFDRTVIIECENDKIEETNNSTITLLFTERSSKKVSRIDVNLCWSLFRRATIGHCHKALFGNVSLHIIQQWLDYHLFIGVEQIHIYDRTLNYKSFFQPYIDRDQVIYIPFPLASQIADREHFNWIDQFVGKMHCLMRTRTTFKWLGTWDIDEYIDFFSDKQTIFISDCPVNGSQCRSMLSNYLTEHFTEYDAIVLNGLNYMGIRSNVSKKSSVPLIVEQFQHRLTTWNDRPKYLTRLEYTTVINIHLSFLSKGRFTYDTSFKPMPRNMIEKPQLLIHIAHYPSAENERDHLFFELLNDNGTRKYVHDPVLCKVSTKLLMLQRIHTRKTST